MSFYGHSEDANKTADGGYHYHNVEYIKNEGVSVKGCSVAQCEASSLPFGNDDRKTLVSGTAGFQPLPARQQLWKELTQMKEDHFDVLIIGGGATGTGCALDAQTRYAPCVWVMNL